MSDVHSSSSSDDYDDLDYQTCDEDDDVNYHTCDEEDDDLEYHTCDENDDVVDYHTCDEDDEQESGDPRAASPSSSSSDDGRDWLDYHHSSDDEEEEEVDVFGAAAPVVAVKKDTQQLYTRSITGGSNTTVVQLNVTQQQFGDVTVEKATHVNQMFGGSQNISKTETIYERQKRNEPSRKDVIMKRTISRIKDWNQDMVRTAALGQVLDKLNKGITWLTIKGNPGEGKTTVGYMALEELHRCGRQVFEVRSPEDFTEIIETCSRPVIMLDDVFGNLEFDNVEWSTWKHAISSLLKEREHKSHEEEDQTSKKDVIVILIGRDYVLNPASVDLGRLSNFLTSEKHVVCMDHSMNRSLEEKHAILESISKSSGTKLDEMTVNEIMRIQVPHGFPHVCRLFTTIYKENKTICAVDFFRKPLEFLNSSILNLFKDKNKLRLFREMVKADGNISKKELRKVDPQYKIIQTANSLVGTYIKVEQDCFVFDHQSIYDSVAFHLCSLDSEFVIKMCHLSFIHERIRIQFSQDTKSENSYESSLVVFVERCYEDDLAERFANAIMARNFHVLSHQAFTDGTFVRNVMTRIITPLNSLFHLPIKEQLSLMKRRSPNWTNEITVFSLVPSNKSPELLKYIDNCQDITLNEHDEKIVLYGTCRYAASEVLTYLINTRKSLDINIRFGCSIDKTPLMVAVETRDVHFVHQILSLSPDLNVKTNKICPLVGTGRGESPLHYACRNNQLEVVKLLIEKGAIVDGTSLIEACREGNLQIVELLFEKRDNLDTKDILNSSLSAASEGGNVDIMNLLVDKGATIDSTDPFLSPLLVACGYQQIQVVHWLLQQGADIEIRDRGGDTALHKAAECGSRECVEMLVEAGVTVDILNNEGNTALHTAAERGFAECVEMLLKADATVDIQNKEGDTAFHRAAERESRECVELLVKAGATVDLLNKECNTSL